MTLDVMRQFEDARHMTAVLRPFATVPSLLEFLDAESSSWEEKDAVYRALVRAVQTRARWAPAATAVLWCGLWPGLDALYRRQLRYFSGDYEELTSLIGLVFTTQLAEFNSPNVRRVAATLVRNTGRDVVRLRLRQRAVAPRTSPTTALSERPRVEALPAHDTVESSILGMPPGLSTASQVAYLQGWLRSSIGDDAVLFLAVAVLGADPQVIARQFRLSPTALRKRIQKIRTRLIRSWSQNTSQNGMY
jgi:hypothetical protein